MRKLDRDIRLFLSTSTYVETAFEVLAEFTEVHSGIDARRPQLAGALALSRPQVAGLIAQYAAAYAWRHYGKSSVQRGALSVLGWPRWTYKRVKHAALLVAYHALVTSRRLRGRRPLERTHQ